MYELAAAAPALEPPAYLVADGDGRRLWDSVVSGYQLRPDELRILEDACATADEIAYWRREAAECRAQAHGERVVQGSTKQRKLNPLIVRADKAAIEARQNRALLKNLLSSLKLPDFGELDEGEDQAGDRTSAARSA